jgi:hypothetical protein
VFILVGADHLDLDKHCARRLSRSEPGVPSKRGGIDTLHDYVQSELKLLSCEYVRDRVTNWSEGVRQRGPGNDRLLDAIHPKVGG